MSEMAHFLYSVDDSKSHSQFGQRIESPSERSYLAISEKCNGFTGF